MILAIIQARTGSTRLPGKVLLPLEGKSIISHVVERVAAAKLIEMSKGKVAGFIFVINLFDLGGCDQLIKKNYKVENLIEFPGH